MRFGFLRRRIQRRRTGRMIRSRHDNLRAEYHNSDFGRYGKGGKPLSFRQFKYRNRKYIRMGQYDY